MYIFLFYVFIHDAIIGGQPVHDAIVKIHDAIMGGQQVHGAIAKIRARV